ncbi:MAG: hypothetical protein AAFX94_02625 [Myxococcota bacterium]
MRALTLTFVLTLAVGCEDEARRPQIVFQIEADTEFNAVATWLRVQIFDQDGGRPFDGMFRAREAIPAEIPTVAREDDASRWVRVHAELFDTPEEPSETDVPIAVIDSTSTFTEESVRYVRLRFARACQDTKPCADGFTCYRGVCRGACFDTDPDEDALEIEPRCGRCEACRASNCTPVEDDTACGCPGDRCSDGECQASGLVQDISSGLTSTCVVRSGQVLCWGSNEYAELGVSDAGRDNPNPIPVPLPGPAIAVTTRGTEDGTATAHSCALLEDGALYCWGSNGSGQLGLGLAGEAIDAPTVLPQVPDGIVAISNGGLHSCARTGTGALWCWGDNRRGQLGVPGAAGRSDVPVEVLSPSSAGWDSHCTGSLHTCAIEAGRVYCWGFNSDAQAGVPPGDNIVDPSPIALDDSTGFTSVACGAYHTCALATDKRAFCWGGNSFGNLGREPSELDGAPAPVNGGLAFEEVSCGRSHCCALEEGGGLWCWGRNTQGQLGVGSDVIDRFRPTRTTGPEKSWTALALGEVHSCAVRDDQFIWCWGENTRGQLALGDTDRRFNPSVVCPP